MRLLVLESFLELFKEIRNQETNPKIHSEYERVCESLKRLIGTIREDLRVQSASKRSDVL